MRNIAIIPARSGSKGLKDKNIKLLNGKPLIAYTIEAAVKSNIFDKIIVSTDSKEYADLAREWGAIVPFLRNEELSSDTASSWDVVKDVLLSYKKNGEKFDTVALLQPTSPLRTSDDIIKGYSKMKQKNANLVVGICRVDHSPLWSNTLPEDSSLTNFINQDVVMLPRQSLPPYYRINGSIYIVKSDYLMSIEDIYSDKSFGLVMPRKNSIDIDNQLDFKIAEVLMKDSD